MGMEYVYAALLLHKAGKKVDESSLVKVLDSAGIKADVAMSKAVVASLEGVDIDKAIKEAAVQQVAVAAPVAAAGRSETKPEKKEEEKKSAEEAAAGPHRPRPERPARVRLDGQRGDGATGRDVDELVRPAGRAVPKPLARHPRRVRAARRRRAHPDPYLVRHARLSAAHAHLARCGARADLRGVRPA